MSVHLDTASRHSAGDGPPPSAYPPVKRGGRYGFTRLDLRVSPYLYVLPFFIIFGIFGLYPLIYTFVISLQHKNLLGKTSEFIGFDNFKELFADAQFWNSVYNTIGIFVISTIPQLLLALILASVLNRNIRGRLLFRLGIAIPIVTSTAVIGLVFGQLFSRDYGLINYLLHFIGVHPIDWKANVWSSWIGIATMVNWRWTGYNALIYLAAMQSVPRDVYESAALDGASQTRQFWSITIPMIRPTIVFTVIISTIGGFQLFGEPLLFSSGAGSLHGGALREYQTVSMYLYEQMFERGRLGYAGAIAWTLFLIILIVSILNFLLVRRISATDK